MRISIAVAAIVAMIAFSPDAMAQVPRLHPLPPGAVPPQAPPAKPPVVVAPAKPPLTGRAKMCHEEVLELGARGAQATARYRQCMGRK